MGPSAEVPVPRRRVAPSAGSRTVPVRLLCILAWGIPGLSGFSERLGESSTGAGKGPGVRCTRDNPATSRLPSWG
jgi:hypothetical protein